MPQLHIFCGRFNKIEIKEFKDWINLYWMRSEKSAGNSRRLQEKVIGLEVAQLSLSGENNAYLVGMLIPGKLHSRIETRNSRVSIETLAF